ncbi:SET domain, partial [Dillenia turbinata]
MNSPPSPSPSPPPPPPPPPPPILYVYSRRREKSRDEPSFFDAIRQRSQSQSLPVKLEQFDESFDVAENGEESAKKRRRKSGNSELSRLGVSTSSVLRSLEGPRLRDCRNKKSNADCSGRKRKRNPDAENVVSSSAKRWVRLCFEDVDPHKFVGLQCKASVFWPLDDDWYPGRVSGYNSETNRHQVKYDDGDQEDLIISNEKIKFNISKEEMESLNLNYSIKGTDNDGFDYSEMLVLAASLDSCQDLGPGDVIWGKLTGHATWPGIIVDESVLGDHTGLKSVSGARSFLVQFFGTHDFARLKGKQVIPFLRGLLSDFHEKCKKSLFFKGLEEAKGYLNEQKLPDGMLWLQNVSKADDHGTASGEEDQASIDSGEDCSNRVTIGTHGGMRALIFESGDLQIIKLGKVVKDSNHFRHGKFIWPEGYTALRKFISLTDPSNRTLYKMEVLRDVELRTRPLFRVTTDNGEQFEASTPSGCWDKIYLRIRKLQKITTDANSAEYGKEINYGTGSDMFGLSSPEVMKLIKESSHGLSSKLSCKSSSRIYRDMPLGFRAVNIEWKDLDKCNVCHMDEEYENNLFLQCDKCRMMVHARCYGELEPVNGVLWFCNFCREGAPNPTPCCCLCPVSGGAMKPTTDGRWAHLACAIWIPETCLSDIKRMEPIDGLSRINKDRWKLLCSICGVSYGACIQCSNNTCRVAYHPLCARAAGYCVELEDEDRLCLAGVNEEDHDDDDQCIRLLSFCKKHRQPSNERSAADERITLGAQHCSHSIPPSNPSGCARTEPYNHLGRRGRKEPEALAAASSKRLFVENCPYLVGGHSQHETIAKQSFSGENTGSKLSSTLQKLKSVPLEAPAGVLSMTQKYAEMRNTFRKRLTFGKSGIHGFGIFAKHPHRAGDMVIEYTGELVRPSIADRRESLIYNSLVGAGTYMFRIDDERVIDATRAGSIAHLINHSCEPNCYSRVISVDGDEHIIIFAKRDIKQWEELTYDYRFFSIDERLACYCGFPRCRGVVNDTETEEQLARLTVPR